MGPAHPVPLVPGPRAARHQSVLVFAFPSRVRPFPCPLAAGSPWLLPARGGVATPARAATDPPARKTAIPEAARKQAAPPVGGRAAPPAVGGGIGDRHDLTFNEGEVALLLAWKRLNDARAHER